MDTRGVITHIVLGLILVCLADNANGWLFWHSDDKPVALGGPQELSVTDENVVNLSKLALDHLNANRGTRGEYSLLDVTKALGQVVSGYKTSLVLQVKQNNTLKQCTVDFWDKVGSSTPEVTRADCEYVEIENGEQ